MTVASKTPVAVAEPSHPIYLKLAVFIPAGAPKSVVKASITPSIAPVTPVTKLVVPVKVPASTAVLTIEPAAK
ncbi:hypothetical protein C0995_016120, partial [Termitomyces sp. Mi166